MYECNHTVSTTYDGTYWLIVYTNGYYAIISVINTLHLCLVCGKVKRLDYNSYLEHEVCMPPRRNK